MWSLAFLAPLIVIQAYSNKLMHTLPLLHQPMSTQAKSSKVNNNRMQFYVHPSFCLHRSDLSLTCHGFPVIYHWQDASFVFEACLHHCWPFVVKVRCARQSSPMRGDSWGPSGQILLCKTKSFNKGQTLEALCGQSLLCKTKTSDKGQFLEALCGQSPLHKTKSSDKGQFLEALCGWSPLRETKSSNKGQFLRPFVVKVSCAGQSSPTRGSSWGPCGQSPLCKTTSSDYGQILETPGVKVCCTWQSPPTRGKLWGLPGPSPLSVTKTSTKGQASRHNVKFASTKISPPTRGRILGMCKLCWLSHAYKTLSSWCTWHVT